MKLKELQFERPGKMSADRKEIYIVDDDESVRRSLKLLMVSYGLDVRTFSSAEEFFSAVPNSADGCLIMDLHMPGLKGWEAHQRILKSGSRRPVIIITVDNSGGLKERAIESGIAGFLQKPFDDQELLSLINQIYVH